MNEANYKYAVLPEQELVFFLRDTFNLNCEKNDIIKPEKDFVFEVLTKFMEGLGFENFLQVDLEATSCISNLEYLESALKLSTLSKHIGFLLKHTGFNEFAISDLVFPKRRRVQKVFSQLVGIYIDFCMIRKEWSDCEEPMQDMNFRKSCLYEKNQELQEIEETKILELKDLKKQMTDVKLEISEVFRKTEEMQSKNEQLNLKKKTLKKEHAEKLTELNQLDCDLTQLKIESNDLKKNLICTPDKYLEQLNKRISDLQEKRIEKIDLESKYYVCMNRCEILKNKFDKYCESNFQSELPNQIDQLKQLCITLDGLKEKMDEIQIDLEKEKKALEQQEEINFECIKQLENDFIQLKNNSKTIEDMCIILEKELAKKESADNAINREDAENQLKLEEIRKNIQFVEQSQEQLKDDFQTKLHDYINKLKKVFEWLGKRGIEIN